jgi:hypothetical protein
MVLDKWSQYAFSSLLRDGAPGPSLASLSKKFYSILIGATIYVTSAQAEFSR